MVLEYKEETKGSVLFGYEVNGTWYRGRSTAAVMDVTPRVGDKVEIVYDPQSPEVMCACDPAEQLVIVDSEAPLTAIILAVVGILFGLALHSTFQRYRKEFYG